jgi:diguanylate cyclase (GGDEF)-like protein
LILAARRPIVLGMDRRLLLGIVPAAAGVALGAAAAASGSPTLAIGAAAGAALAGSATAAMADRLRRQDDAAHALAAEVVQLRDAVEASREAVEAASRFAKMIAARQLEARHEAQQAMEHPPLLDRETGLLDDRYFQVALDHRIAAARRQLQPVALLLISLDGDGVGDSYREEAVSSFAQTVRETLRDSDTACRIGAARFAVILEDTPEAGGVWAAERLRMAMLRKGGSLLRFSAAVAAYPSHALDAGEVLTRAQRALDQARTNGTSHVEVATAD